MNSFMKMLSIFIISIFFVVSVSAGDYTKSISLGIGFSQNRSKSYFPIPSFSYYWIRPGGFHELTLDYSSVATMILDKSESISGGGLLYSYVFKFPDRHFYLGPSIGISIYLYEKNISDDYLDGYHPEKNDRIDGFYFGGIKGCYILGDKLFRIILQDCLLLGAGELNGEGLHFDFLNNISLGVLFALPDNLF